MYGGVGVPQQMAYWPQGMPVPQQGGEGYPYAAMQQLQYAQQVPDQFPGVTGVQQDKNK
jgi:hypothetical protein